MNTYTTVIMLTTELSTLQLKYLHLKHALYFIFGKYIAIDGQYDIDREKKCIAQIQLAHQMVQE
jgi:hypothetical protein